MTIQFKNIPSNLRVPLFYAELDASQANTASDPQRSLLIGQMTVDGSAQPNYPVLCTSVAAAHALAGQGSMLSIMIDAYRANDPAGELWLLPIADDPAATASVRTITFTGPPAEAGVISLYIDDILVPIAVTAGMTAAQIGDAALLALSAANGLPVSVAQGVDHLVLTLTQKWKGASNSAISVNLLGAPGGQKLPAGVSVMPANIAAGTMVPSLSIALANLGDMPFDFIGNGYADAVSLASVTALLNDTTGRWSWQHQIFGHAFSATGGTVASLAAIGATLNDQHLTLVGRPGAMRSSSYKVAAAFAGAAAVSLRNDPSLPLQYVAVQGLLGPQLPAVLAGGFSLTMRNMLLFDGISTFLVGTDNSIAIENLITTYQSNAQGQPDNSYLQVETMFQLMYVLRRLRSVVTTKYARVKLAADGTRILPGTNVVTPSTIRADIIAAYRQLEAEEAVQQSDVFAANLIVEKDAANPNRINVLWPGALIDQLRTFALLAQFRLS